ncbi:hypothetical protein [Variovorax ginsengisoli]|uniref:Uncharacterized protein n=1 Tax=Variovorax ginsengisoli TaxID=363844 RepID=A0ABT9SCS7_9BURK|nr:hypothetical protein [Variovorax ginsengisoli]MDP9901653.1 hypothetical protein [Variovorax ginsengisoli]
MLIATKIAMASGVAALALGGPAVVDPANADAAGAQRASATVAAQETPQQRRMRQWEASTYCPAGCSIGQAFNLRH